MCRLIGSEDQKMVAFILVEHAVFDGKSRKSGERGKRDRFWMDKEIHRIEMAGNQKLVA